MQAKLLRSLQERTVRPVGSNTEVAFNTRIIAATNRDLETEIHERRFREDLYYRIAVVVIELPPLRDRSGDVPLMAQHFVKRFAERHGKRCARPAVSLRLETFAVVLEVSLLHAGALSA